MTVEENGKALSAIPSRRELRQLCGGWRRVLNPFRSDLSRIKAKTRHDPVLRRRAVMALRENGGEGVGPIQAMGILLALSYTGVVFLPSVLASIALLGIMCCFLAAPFALFAIGARNYRLHKAALPPILPGTGTSASTGWVALDRVASADPYTAEAALLAGGIDEEELRSLAAVIASLASSHEEAGGLVAVSRTPSLRAENLVSRACSILWPSGVCGELSPPTMGMLDALAHAGAEQRAMEESR